VALKTFKNILKVKILLKVIIPWGMWLCSSFLLLVWRKNGERTRIRHEQCLNTRKRNRKSLLSQNTATAAPSWEKNPHQNVKTQHQGVTWPLPPPPPPCYHASTCLPPFLINHRSHKYHHLNECTVIYCFWLMKNLLLHIIWSRHMATPAEVAGVMLMLLQHMPQLKMKALIQRADFMN
jgi:hypothetical protein